MATAGGRLPLFSFSSRFLTGCMYFCAHQLDLNELHNHRANPMTMFTTWMKVYFIEYFGYAKAATWAGQTFYPANFGCMILLVMFARLNYMQCTNQYVL